MSGNAAPPWPAAPLPGQWTFWADTIIGGIPLGPVQPSGFSCGWKLSGFGTGQVTLPAGYGALDQDRMLRLWSWRLWCYYAGDLMWCGVPSGIADEGRENVSLTLTELPGYLGKRVWDQPGTYRFSQVEQTEIARAIAAPVSDVGVRLVAEPGPGFPRDRSYEYLESGSRADLLSNLSEVISGPEFRTEYASDAAGLPLATLRIAYPRVGADSGLAINVPGTAVDYRAAWDSDAMRTRTFAVGDLPEDAAEGAARPVAVVDAPQPDLPRLDAADDWPGTILLATLQQRAAAAAAVQAAPALELGASVSAANPPLGTYRIGDDVLIRIVSPLLPGGVELPGRLTEMTASGGEGSVTWTVATTQPPAQTRMGLAQRLDRLDSRVSRVFRRNLVAV